MTVLVWIAALVGLWCTVSVVTALALGTFLRRRHEATDPHGALRPLAVGPLASSPLDLWVGILPDVPDTPAELDGDPVDVPDLPSPRTAPDEFLRVR